MLPTAIKPMARIRPDAHSAREIARMIWHCVRLKGCHQVSMDMDGRVFATPADHPFSQAMLRQYADRIVGTYTRGAAVDDIMDDLLTQWKSVQGTRA